MRTSKWPLLSFTTKGYTHTHHISYICMFVCVYMWIHTHTHTFSRAVLKVMPPFLLCWAVTPEEDVGSLAVEVEPSRQYSIPLGWQHRDSLTKKLLTQKHTWNKVVAWNSFMQEKKKSTHWHSLMPVECMENKQWMWAQWGGGWCISALVTVTVDHPVLCRFWCMQHGYSSSSLAKMHS